MADSCDRLHRVAGGYWAKSDHPAVAAGDVRLLKDGEWVNSQTILACLARDWLTYAPVAGTQARPAKQPVAITSAGRAALASY
jgi:hypothetical protein